MGSGLLRFLAPDSLDWEITPYASFHPSFARGAFEFAATVRDDSSVLIFVVV